MQTAHANRETEPVEDAPPAAARALRVAGIDPERGFAGGETQALGLTLALVRAGHCAELICDPAGELWTRARAEGLRCHPLAIRNAIDAAAGMRLRAIIRRGHYDVVHFHTSRAHAMAPFVRGAARALVVTRRMDYRPNRLFAPLLFGRAVDCVIAISEGVAGSIAAAGVVRERIAVVPSGVDCERFRPPSPDERAHARAALGIGAEEIVVAAVGALHQRKGHRFLIEAIASHAETARLRCLIAGDGPLRNELEAEIARLGCTARVRLLGRIGDPRELLRAADIFAMPSLKEGLGVAALEAMACGLPVVASAVGGLNEAVVNKRTGIIVAPERSDELAAAIARLAAASELRNEMGAAGRIRAVENYSMETMAAQTLALYRKCPGIRDAAGTE
ncbi:MAG: glycosyltransferase [Candidatus Binataceae bacterium]